MHEYNICIKKNLLDKQFIINLIELNKNKQLNLITLFLKTFFSLKDYNYFLEKKNLCEKRIFIFNKDI